MRRVYWRLFFLAAGVFILMGGPRHPAGTMQQMLESPEWVPSHSLLSLGFLALLFGLLFLPARKTAAAGARRWLHFAIAGTAIQVVEMVLHTAAYVDAGNLAAGRATPVLSTHLAMAAVAYPLFGLSLSGWIIAATREKVLGSVWIAWLGILGAVAHGAAAPLTILLGQEWPRVLFPMLMFFAIWSLLAGVWPVKAPPQQESRSAAARG